MILAARASCDMPIAARGSKVLTRTRQGRVTVMKMEAMRGIIVSGLFSAMVAFCTGGDPMDGAGIQGDIKGAGQ